jgi:outer membrane protein OmpA-like peptidoglycan-associated protein
MANIPRAQSGMVPNSAVKSGPLGRQIEVAVIQFGRASSGLGDNDLGVLARVAQMQRRNGGSVRVVAHSARDAYGSSDADLERGNYEVSKRRALAIANQLMQLGVPRSAIIAEAASDGEPMYETNTARGIAANRRAEVYLDF